MNRFLSIAVLCLLGTACSSSSNNDDESTRVGPSDNGLNPTTMLLESPPTNGKLPADLVPPS
jgi:hypothetical protein